VYGISAWNLRLDRTLQRDLAITLPDEPTITVDNVEVAQFLYLLLSNNKIRDVLDAVSAKNVLILGRFTPERKIVLDSLRDELRRQNYLPILFDFSKPTTRDVTETLVTLAGMARFVIADISDPASIVQELMAITSSVVVPIVPILQAGSTPFGMFQDLARYPRVLEPIQYQGMKGLIHFL
jgi:hypothetical protein